MTFFTDENLALAEEIIGRYPKPRSAMIPLLHLAQEQEGWVTDDAMTQIGELVGYHQRRSARHVFFLRNV